MQASMLEIYNEEYRDLLAKRSKGKDSQASQSDSKKHQVRFTLKSTTGFTT